MSYSKQARKVTIENGGLPTKVTKGRKNQWRKEAGYIHYKHGLHTNVSSQVYIYGTKIIPKFRGVMSRVQHLT